MGVCCFSEQAPGAGGSATNTAPPVPQSPPAPLPVVLTRPGEDEHVWLRVKGRHIVTSPLAEGGERPFIACGIGYCRDVIIKAQDEEVMKFCRAKHLNTVRLSFYTRFFNNKKDKPIDIDEHIRTFIAPVVSAARRHKLYVILDDHGYLSAEINEETARDKQKARQWEEPDIAAWTAAWVKVAQYFKDEPYILGYELMNEPHDIPAEDARAKLTRCLKAVREVDQRHIILLSNHNWSHSRAMEKCWGPVATTVDAPHNNVAFTFHDYPEDDHPWKVQRNVTEFMQKHNVPVMCTEFGATHWNKSETVCREFQAGMLAMCAKNDIGWMIWALKRLEDNPRAPYNEVDKTGLGPPKVFDSCPYSDLWPPVARIMASSFPKLPAPAAATPSPEPEPAEAGTAK
ncbi:hypothetical protein DB346_20575 [Verrucomicrobia bacterium LW23]|nr:hypothetical protein DB346_20575 [Verrucomicrobia bacterium LW23]